MVGVDGAGVRFTTAHPSIVIFLLTTQSHSCIFIYIVSAMSRGVVAQFG